MPSPGETALVLAAVLASQGKLQIELVIAIGVASAIIGDNIGYLLGRKFGREVLEAPGPFEHRRRRLICGRRPFLRAAWVEGGVLRTVGRAGPDRSGVAGRDQPHALPGVLLLERARRAQLGDHVRAGRLLRRPRGGQPDHALRRVRSDRARRAGRRRARRDEAARAALDPSRAWIAAELEPSGSAGALDRAAHERSAGRVRSQMPAARHQSDAQPARAS